MTARRTSPAPQNLLVTSAVPAEPKWTPRPWRRRLGRAALGACLLVLAAWTAFSIWAESCVFEPPALPAAHPSYELRAEDVRPGLRRFGAAWARVDQGMHEVYLDGDAVARGRAVAALCLPAL